QGVEDERAQVVNAAADAEAVVSVAVAQAAEGLVVADVRSHDDHGAGSDIDTAAIAVAAVAPAVAVAAEGSVVVDGGREDRRGAPREVEAAAQPLPAAGRAGAVMAEGYIVCQGAGHKCEDAGTGDAAARTLAGASAAGTGSASFGLVVGECTAYDRDDRQ